MLTVFYDGACVLCRREIAFYRRRRGADRIVWSDVSDPTTVLPAGLNRDAALARFHVLTPQGELAHGAAAFSALWSALPSLRWLGVVTAWWPFRPIMSVGYDLFLRVRPALQRRLSGPPTCEGKSCVARPSAEDQKRQSTP